MTLVLAAHCLGTGVGEAADLSLLPGASQPQSRHVQPLTTRKPSREAADCLPDHPETPPSSATSEKTKLLKSRYKSRQASGATGLSLQQGGVGDIIRAAPPSARHNVWGPLWLGPVCRQRMLQGGEPPIRSLWDSATRGRHTCPQAAHSLSKASQTYDEEFYKMQIHGPLPNLLNHSLRAGALESVFFQSLQPWMGSQHREPRPRAPVTAAVTFLTLGDCCLLNSGSPSKDPVGAQ